MEQILSYYAPNLSFDVPSLRKAAMGLKDNNEQPRDYDFNASDTRVDIDELEDLAIDDEDFTIQALPDNTTRESFTI